MAMERPTRISEHRRALAPFADRIKERRLFLRYLHAEPTPNGCCSSTAKVATASRWCSSASWKATVAGCWLPTGRRQRFAECINALFPAANADFAGTLFDLISDTPVAGLAVKVVGLLDKHLKTNFSLWRSGLRVDEARLRDIQAMAAVDRGVRLDEARTLLERAPALAPNHR